MSESRLIELEPAWPCPECGKNLNCIVRREPLTLREWLLHPIDSFATWRYRRWLKSADGIRYYGAMHVLINHAKSVVLHELSPKAYASWGTDV